MFGKETRDEISTICSCLLTAEIIIHAEKYPDRLGAVRKVCKMLAQELGVTRADLKPLLQTKLDEFQKIGEETQTLCNERLHDDESVGACIHTVKEILDYQSWNHKI